MLRWACVLITVTACAGSGPPPARLFPAGTGECPDATGCGVPVAAEPKFIPPDEVGGVPREPDLGPAEARSSSCTDVGDSAASTEIGNYAPVEERAPIATKYRGRCRTLRLDQAERECVVSAEDVVSMAYCAPRFVPHEVVALVDVRACAVIANQIRARGNALADAPKGQGIWERQLIAVQRSCEQDRWTVAFGECARMVPVATTVASYCQYEAPTPLLIRLNDRMANVK